MDKTNSFKSNPQSRSSRPHNPCFSPQNLIVVFTVLSLLIRMKEKLGFEAMLEYMAYYLRIVGTKNPSIQAAVGRALDVVDIERIYEDTLSQKP